MKKLQLLNWMLVALIAFTFSACDNEPLEGEFIIDNGGGGAAEEGQFVATIGRIVYCCKVKSPYRCVIHR